MAHNASLKTSDDSTGVDTTIIAAAYNAAHYLERFFTCLVRQSYQGFRLVLVDDCSSDATAAFAEGLGTLLGERFVFLRNEQHAGLSATRNTGLAWAAAHPTKYVSFLDVDDWFEDGYLEDLHTCAEETGAGLCIAGIVRAENGKTLSTEMVNAPRQVISDASACTELAYLNPCAYAKLYRFKNIADFRFRPVLRSEDTCYLFEVLPHLGSVAFTNRALYHYEVHRGALSGEVTEETYASMHEHFAAMMPLFTHELYAPFRDLFETQVFIRSSIGGVLRLSKTSRKTLAELAEEERAWLDSAMPGWRTNPFLSSTKQSRRQTGRLLSKQGALAFAANAYKRGQFVSLARLYMLYRRIFGREVRL